MTAPRDPAHPFASTGSDEGASEGPVGYVVLVDEQERIHFVDWTVPTADPSARAAGSTGQAQATGSGAAILLIHGLAQTAHVWAPVARRLRLHRSVVAMDLRGHGLSDAPTTGYDLGTLATDAVAVAEGSGALDVPGARVVVAGHGFGAIVAAAAALVLGDRCAGLVLVDGGWEDLDAATGLSVDEFLRALEEPPEVLESLAAYLADRAAFDPSTWDADQEAAARAAVIELPAGRVVSATRPHALEACVRSMFDYRPIVMLSGVAALGTPIHVLAAAEDEAGGRLRALDRVDEALAALGRPLSSCHRFPSDGHNLMRYRPADVTQAILEVRRG